MPLLFHLKDHFKENKIYLNRTVASLIFVISLFLILTGRMFYLQVIQHDLYSTLSHKNQVRIQPMPPTRGLIYDRNGVVLAENIPTFNLEIIPARQASLKTTISELAKIINLSEDEIDNFNNQLKYHGRSEGIPIKVKLTEEEVARVTVEQYRFEGVRVAAKLIRNYPKGELFAHVIGFVGTINPRDNLDPAKYRGTFFVGKTGLEHYYEDILHGNVGYRHAETDAKGRTIRILEKSSPKNGKNLKLSIDSRLQKITYDALGKKRGAVVAIDPNTGGVLAMVSKPGFDPNVFITGIDHKSYTKLTTSKDKPLFNRALKGTYPPGSTIKPLVALQGLDTKTITRKTAYFDPGWYQIEGDKRLYRDWLRSGHGWMNVENAIAESCTTFFFFLSHKLGIDKLHNIFHRFGIGRKTGIDISGEATGLNPSRKWKLTTKGRRWFPGDTLNTGIGQGDLLATPLQIAVVAQTLANQGKVFSPKLVQFIGNDHVISQTPNYIIELQEPKYWDFIVKSMRKTIHGRRGTAKKINKRLSYDIAGKTGTAQVYSLKTNEIYSEQDLKEELRDHSWFMAFAPTKDPKLAIAVIVENNKGSAAIAKIIFDKYFGITND